LHKPLTYHESDPATGKQEGRQVPLLSLPTLADATILSWDTATAKSKGIYGFDSLDARSRPFNMIRAKLHEFRSERGWRLFGVVSATPKVGKSFIAANVAASLSRDPRFQTTAIDLDLRRASLTDVFNIEPGVSIRAYLEGQTAEPPTAYTLEGENLIILPTTPGPIRSAELLAGAQAQALFSAMRASNEKSIFIVDLPPVFANDDAVTAMAQLDGYVVVVEEGRTTTREVKDVVGLLGFERLAGVVLNKYRGGLVSEGYGVDNYYAAGYYSGRYGQESD